MSLPVVIIIINIIQTLRKRVHIFLPEWRLAGMEQNTIDNPICLRRVREVLDIACNQLQVSMQLGRDGSTSVSL